MQPATIVIADIEAVCLRQFVHCRFEESDCAIDLAPIIRVGERRICRQHANERAQLRHLSLEAAKGIRTGGIHGGRCRRSCCGVKSRNLDEYQTGRESRHEGHHCGRNRDSERQHPISSAHPAAAQTKKQPRATAKGPLGADLCEIAKARKPASRRSSLTRVCCIKPIT